MADELNRHALPDTIHVLDQTLAEQLYRDKRSIPLAESLS